MKGPFIRSAAERMRMVAETAIEHAHLAEEEALIKLEGFASDTVTNLRSDINSTIDEMANLRGFYANYTYSSRISKSRNLPEDVALIEDIADIVTLRVLESLRTNGYGARSVCKEVVDHRDNYLSPAEYYDNTLYISW